jgi:hypothetical protein
MAPKLTWKPTPDWKPKNPKASGQICRIGEDNDHSEFYETQKVTAQLATINVGDEVDFKFEKITKGKYTANVLSSITKVANAEPTAQQQQPKVAGRTYNTKTADEIASIERQTTGYISAEILKALQGQVTPAEIGTLFCEVFDVVASKIITVK